MNSYISKRYSCECEHDKLSLNMNLGRQFHFPLIYPHMHFSCYTLSLFEADSVCLFFIFLLFVFIRTFQFLYRPAFISSMSYFVKQKCQSMSERGLYLVHGGMLISLHYLSRCVSFRELSAETFISSMQLCCFSQLSRPLCFLVEAIH